MKFLLIVMLLCVAASPAQADLRNGLLVWYKFDETSGLNAVDSSGNGNTGTLQNSPTRVGNCKRGNCLYFNGTDQYVSLASLTSASVPSITVSFWNYVRTADVKVSGPFSFDNGNSANRILMHAPYSDRIIYWDYGNATPGQGRVSIDYTNYLDRWTLVTASYNASTNLHALYLNGVLVVSNTNANTPSTITGFSVGRYYDNGSISYHKGHIDDFRLYNRALSASEVADLYKSGTVIKNAVLRNSRINQ